MRVAVYGATGRAGSRIVQELARRGHEVLAIARDGAAAGEPPGVTWAADDLSDAGKIAQTIGNARAVVSAYAPPAGSTDELAGVCERLAEAAALTGARLMVVGGAGVLQVAPGLTLLDSGKLPEAWVPIARSHAKALRVLQESDANWTYLSPAAMFEPGERRGAYRVSKDMLLTDAQGESRISMEDYAIAVADELERPAHERAGFAVAW